MNADMPKEVSEKMPVTETVKEKRYLSHQHGVDCPPTYHQHAPITLLKPQSKIITPSYHQPMYHNIWQQPMYNLHNSHQPLQSHGWQPHGWQQQWQPKVIVQKPHSYAPMYHHQPSYHHQPIIQHQPSYHHQPIHHQPIHHHQPSYHQNLVKYQLPIVYQKPCAPMPCKPVHQSYHYPKSEIKYVQPQPQVSYIKVPQPVVHQPVWVPPVHSHHGVKEICLK